jgi:hypothetical protein
MKTLINDNKKILILIYLIFITSIIYSQTYTYLGNTYQYQQMTGNYIWSMNTSSIGAWSLDDGKYNSTQFLNTNPSGNNACDICENLNISNCSEWYLPSAGELQEVLQNNTGLSGSYWSSTEYYPPTSSGPTPTQALVVYSNGSIHGQVKTGTTGSYKVICIKKITNSISTLPEINYNGGIIQYYPLDNAIRNLSSSYNNVCNNLDAFGYSDWRLATFDELNSIHSANPLNGLINGINTPITSAISTRWWVNSPLPILYVYPNGSTNNTTANTIDFARCRCVRDKTTTGSSTINLSINSTNPNCSNSNDGTATVTATGGTPPYSYLWNDGSNTASISNLPTCTYSVTVTDASSNTETTLANVFAPSNLNVTGSQLIHESSIGTNDGSINISVAEGTTPYSINVTNGGSYSQTINSSVTNHQLSNLTSGIYTASVTDNNGCAATTNITLTTAPNVITSSWTGGNWHSTSTWIGGQIPTANDSVIINSAVYNNTPAYCIGMKLIGSSCSLTNNDTLYIAGSLEVVSDFIATTMNVKINGDFINNSTFTIADNSNNIKVGGNFINNDIMQFWVNDTIYIDGDLINNHKSGYHYSAIHVWLSHHRCSTRGYYNIKGNLENTGPHFKSNVIFSNLSTEQEVKGGNYRSIFFAAAASVNIKLSEDIPKGVFHNYAVSSSSISFITYGVINIKGPTSGRATLNLNGYTIAASMKNMNIISSIDKATIAASNGYFLMDNVGVYIPKVTLYNVRLSNCDLIADTLYLGGSPFSSAQINSSSIISNNIRVNYGNDNRFRNSIINANSIDIMASMNLDTVNAVLGTLNNYGSLSIKGTVSIENDFWNKGSTYLFGNTSSQFSLVTDVTVKGSFINTNIANFSSGIYDYAFKVKKDIVLYSDINCKLSLTGDSTQYIMGQANISSLELINDANLFNASPQWKKDGQILTGGGFDTFVIPNFYTNSSSNPYSRYQCFTQNGLSRKFHVIHGTRVAQNNDFYVGIEAFDGGCDSVSGTINLHPVGGISPYLYNWNNISGNYTGNSPSNLQSNTYNVTVTDQTNNTINTSAAINSNLTINTTDVTCAGGSNGMASIILNNGFTTYLANWGGVTPNTLSAGNYSVTVSNNNCSISENYTISDPSGLSPTINITSSDVTCFGDSNGSATINIIPNTPPVQTLYSNTQFIGSSDGDMHFSFNTGNLNQDLTLVIKGRGPHGQSTNYLTIYDENDNIIATNILQYGTSCSNSYDTIILNSNDIVGWTSDSILNFKVIASYYYYGYNLPSSCNSYEITLDITDSWTHPTYIWSNGQNTATANNLSVGNYSVTATNSSGCPILRNVTIGSPTAAPKPTITQINSFTLESSPALTYKWYFKGGIPTGSTTQTITPLVSEEYVVEVGYANGCIEQSDPFYFIKVNTSSFLSEENKLIIAPNPNKGQFEIIVESLPFGEWEMSIFSITGQLIHSEKINILKANTSIPIDIENVEEGMYILRIKNKESQIIRRKFMIRD